MIVLTLVVAFGTAVFSYLNPRSPPAKSEDRLVYLLSESDSHKFTTTLDSEAFASVNSNLRVTEQKARDAATGYIEIQVENGTISKPHGISNVLQTSYWTLDHDFWVVRFHLDGDYTSRNFVSIVVRMDGVVIEPEVKERIDTTKIQDLPNR